MQLKRIALALGIEPQRPALARSAGEAVRQASQAGLPVFEGRPDDPMLELLLA